VTSTSFCSYNYFFFFFEVSPLLNGIFGFLTLDVGTINGTYLTTICGFDDKSEVSGFGRL
jgi:hypothetical protein